VDCGGDFVRLDFNIIDKASGKDLIFEWATPLSEITFQSSEGEFLPIHQDSSFLSVELLPGVRTYSLTIDSRVSNLTMEFNKVPDECCSGTILASVQSTDLTIKQAEGIYILEF
jgi:hypothetical protein